MSTLAPGAGERDGGKAKRSRLHPCHSEGDYRCRKKLAGKGRILVRFSGTQALCRVMIEGPSQKEITAMANELAEVIRKNMK